MKNIHIIPTDKPSRLHYYYYFDGQPVYGLSTTNLSWRDGRHIYITNDEEIKVGDYFIESLGLPDSYLVHKLSKEWKDKESFYRRCTKVILTTDQDLIKDGVQVIDDEFLEWFVKNPSCEEVEVVDDTLTVREASKLPLGTRNHKYKIIIPKEEPKPESVFENAKSSLKKYLFDNKEKVAKDLEQMREWSNINKQETLEEDDYSKILKATMVPKEYFGTKQDPLEEAAKEYSERHLDVSGTLGKYLVKAVFQDGGKWEQEQGKNKYSEEDLREAFKQSRQAKIFEKDMPPVHNEFEDWFEQFKKK